MVEGPSIQLRLSPTCDVTRERPEIRGLKDLSSATATSFSQEVLSRYYFPRQRKLPTKTTNPKEPFL